jgi:hypothetical protein
MSNKYREALFVLAITINSTAFAGEWLKGDLHSHSNYSDGDSSVADVVASVESKGLDFFALTDHDNDLNGVPRHWFDHAYRSDSTVLLYGIEWSNGDGHANIWSAWPYDYSALWSANQNNDPTAAIEAAHREGALFSVNHPVRHDWEYPVVEGTDCIEIWNGPMIINQNFKATHKFWDDVLMQRRKVTGVGGSDTHFLNDIVASITGHGNPTTWVYADSKDASAILTGIGKGNVSISYSVDAPRLEFRADNNNDSVFETLMGDSLMSHGDHINYKISIIGGSGGRGDIRALPSSLVKSLNEKSLGFWDLLWLAMTLSQMDGDNIQFVTVIKDSELFGAWFISGGTDSIVFNDRIAAGSQAYYRAEVYGQPDVKGISQLIFGLRTAVSNPIYVGY